MNRVMPSGNIHRVHITDQKKRWSQSDYTIDSFRTSCQGLVLTPAQRAESPHITKEVPVPNWKWSTSIFPRNNVLLEDPDSDVPFESRMKTHSRAVPSQDLRWGMGIIRLRLVENYMHQRIFPAMRATILRHTPLINVLICIINDYLPSRCVVSQSHGSVVEDDQPDSERDVPFDLVYHETD